MRLTIVGIVLASASASYAHGGRTDRYGCHTNHSTGVYHCHNDGTDTGASDDDGPPSPGGYHAFNLLLFAGGTVASVLAITEEKKWVVSMAIIGHGFGLATSHLRVPETERRYNADLGTARTTYFLLNLGGLAFDFMILAGLFDWRDDDDVSFQFGLTPDSSGPQWSASFTF